MHVVRDSWARAHKIKPKQGNMIVWSLTLLLLWAAARLCFFGFRISAVRTKERTKKALRSIVVGEKALVLGFLLASQITFAYPCERCEQPTSFLHLCAVLLLASTAFAGWTGQAWRTLRHFWWLAGTDHSPTKLRMKIDFRTTLEQSRCDVTAAVKSLCRRRRGQCADGRYWRHRCLWSRYSEWSSKFG